jgi:hypothetical protein
MKKCPECEKCAVCQECPVCKTNLSLCPKEKERVTVIRYACTNGLIVDSLDKCNPLNYVDIKTHYRETSNGVTLSIDNLEYEKVGDYNRLTEIDYTIINSNEHEIKPIVLVNIYSAGDNVADQGIVHETFEDDEYILANSWYSKKKETNIGFKGNDVIVRLVVRDVLPDPNKELVRAVRPLEVI